MTFCVECESLMNKITTATSEITYTCRCQFVISGTADDTLMVERYIESSNVEDKHHVLIENAPFDHASYVVLKDCPKCGRNYMVLVRIGSNELTMYLCSCGYKTTTEEYTKKLSKK